MKVLLGLAPLKVCAAQTPASPVAMGAVRIDDPFDRRAFFERGADAAETGGRSLTATDLARLAAFFKRMAAKEQPGLFDQMIGVRSPDKRCVLQAHVEIRRLAEALPQLEGEADWTFARRLHDSLKEFERAAEWQRWRVDGAPAVSSSLSACMFAVLTTHRPASGRGRCKDDADVGSRVPAERTILRVLQAR